MIYFKSTTWNPSILAVLCFIRSGNDVLLIHKRRGMGQGKVNGPGGKCEPGELPIDTAIRETQEEVCITPHNLQEHGTLRFQFSDGFQLEGRIFVADVYSGTPADTPEALPFWCPIKKIPYDRMWPDDILWLPRVIAGEYIESAFTFHNDTMITQQIRCFKNPHLMRISSLSSIAIASLENCTSAAAELGHIQMLYRSVTAAIDSETDSPSQDLLSLAEYTNRLGFSELHAQLGRLLQQDPDPKLLAGVDFHYLRTISFLKEQTFLSAVLY